MRDMGGNKVRTTRLSIGLCAQRRVALMSQAIELELARGTFS